MFRMKRIILSTVAVMACAACLAQTTSADFKARFDRQVRNVGYGGVGVETILDRWAEAFPDDGDMLEGRFNHFFAKSRSSSIVIKQQAKYLGADPVLTLKDSLGADVNYFEEAFFVDSLYAESSRAIDRAISLYPDNLGYRLSRITSLLAYEKESPDMATAAILELIDMDAKEHPAWKFAGAPVDGEEFMSTIQEYCYHYFRAATPSCFEAFRAISEKMLSLHPKNTNFMSNIGSYWFVGCQEYKKALKWYNKVPKLDPHNYMAAKNALLVSRKMKDSKLIGKYNDILAGCRNEG